MLYVVNYMGAQVHTGEALTQVDGPFLRFGTRLLVNVQDREVFNGAGARFVNPRDRGYIRPGQKTGSGIVVYDVGDNWIRAGNAEVNVFASDSYAETTADAKGNRGVQYGNGNIQVNRFQ